MRRVSVCRIALRPARIRLLEVRRFNWNQLFNREVPQMWVNPRKWKVSGLRRPCRVRAAAATRLNCSARALSSLSDVE
jgi:hypothetical protein